MHRLDTYGYKNEQFLEEKGFILRDAEKEVKCDKNITTGGNPECSNNFFFRRKMI